MTKFKSNWDETNAMFDAWFHGRDTGRPLMNICAYRNRPLAKMHKDSFDDEAERYLNVEKNFQRAYNRFCELMPMAEAFPGFQMDLGAGSLALYLGCEPKFTKETVWFEKQDKEYDALLPLRFDPENRWFKKHIEILKQQVELSRGTDLMVCIPDIIENIDILAAIRGSENCCYDLFDYPDEVKAAIADLSELYMRYYDAFYDIVKTPQGRSAYTMFTIQGQGKTAKIQCDFAALLSPAQFDEFVLPSLKTQAASLDNVLFHLDGPECIQHVPSIMTIEDIGALQWTPGARNEPSDSPRWYPLYKQVKDAGKGLWLTLTNYKPDEAIAAADRLVSAIGPQGLYLHMPVMRQDEADALLLHAEKAWKASL